MPFVHYAEDPLVPIDANRIDTVRWTAEKIYGCWWVICMRPCFPHACQAITNAGDRTSSCVNGWVTACHCQVGAGLALCVGSRMRTSFR